MKNQKPITVTAKAAALVGAFSLIAVTTTQAAFTALPSPTPETPGVALGAFQAAGGGTVLAVYDSPFVDNAQPTPFASGTLRSFVVDRDAGPGVALDYYYQLVNTSAPPADFTQEFFRLKTTGGFDPSLVLSVGQTDSLAGLVAGGGSGFVAGSYITAGVKPANSADRDVATSGSVGFDFAVIPPPFIGDAANIGQGQASGFLVVRTNSTQYGLVTTAIDGAATSFPSAFAAVPEPSSVLFGLAMFGLTLNSRIKSRRTKVA